MSARLRAAGDTVTPTCQHTHDSVPVVAFGVVLPPATCRRPARYRDADGRPLCAVHGCNLPLERQRRGLDTDTTHAPAVPAEA